MNKSVLNKLTLVGVWFALFAIFSIALPETFATINNLETMIRQTVITGAAAIGMTYIIISGEIDLSVGSLVALVTVIIAWCLQKGFNPIVSALCGILCGILAGTLNGFFVSKLRINSFIVTLASLLAFRGIAKGVSDEKKIDAPLTYLNNLTAALSPQEKWKLLPSGGWLVLILAAVAAYALARTVFGRHVVAIGSNTQTARMCGVNVERTKIGVYAIAGMCFGIAGLLQFARLTVGDPTAASGLELSVIAAVVIGGASLSGGEGSIWGSLLGALIMTTLGTGGSQLGWPNWTQEIVTGCIILAAVAIDRKRSQAIS